MCISKHLTMCGTVPLMHRLNFLYWVRQICCLFSVLFSERPDSTLSSTFSLPSSLLVSQSLMGGLSRDPASISFLFCSVLSGKFGEEGWEIRRLLGELSVDRSGECAAVSLARISVDVGLLGLLCLDKSSGLLGGDALDEVGMEGHEGSGWTRVYRFSFLLIFIISSSSFNENALDTDAVWVAEGSSEVWNDCWLLCVNRWLLSSDLLDESENI